ncbi:MAG: TonB C-terminal domain-containing protein [Gemmatimonadetes bacterium]|nr:TonB C-terminal domain-containing protein [Gemmatimonadota bacterium]
MTAGRGGARLSGPIAASVALHVVAIALVAIRPAMPPLPPLYSVELIAAPAGPRAIGEVRPAEPASPVDPTPGAARSRATPPPAVPAAKARTSGKAIPLAKAKPVKPPRGARAATPVSRAAGPAAPPSPPSTAPAPARTAAAVAGGGPTGDRGADVATVRTDGTAFSFPGYLSNIVRQIALNFRPRSPAASLRCEVAFLIRRDGSVTNLRFVTRSGSYAFDLEAQGAIEAAARSKSFGALPADFADDVLPVTFSFDPRLVR